MQLDAVMDSANETCGAVDQMEFELSVDLGDIGKVGLAHVKTEDMMSATCAADLSVGHT